MKLIGDIGGTNVRFAIVNDDGKVENLIKYKKTEFKDVTDALKTYLKTIKIDVKEAVLAVNTLVLDNSPDDENNYWNYNYPKIKEETGLDKITYLNDLVAHASAIPFLKENEKVKIFGKTIHERGPMVVVGPGTGLGLSYGIYNYEQEKYHFFPSEAGNALASFADEENLNFLHKMFSVRRFVRWEEIISGEGIHNIYKALHNEDKTTESIMEELHKDMEKSQQVWDIFCQFLGVLLRNAATTFLATGGIYIIGGILSRPENMERLKQSKFLKYYHFSSPEETVFIKDYPIYIVNHPNSAFLGLVNY